MVRRSPVTNREYLAFLNDLVARGNEAEALRWVPREMGGHEGAAGAILYGRAQSGEFQLVEDAQGDRWLADYPVMMVDWACAVAYARWLADNTGQPWRLLHEMEWEKAARGVDGRMFPWGDQYDASRAAGAHPSVDAPPSHQCFAWPARCSRPARRAWRSGPRRYLRSQALRLQAIPLGIANASWRSAALEVLPRPH